MLLIAAIVLTAWVLLSVLVLTLCVAAGRADRAIELIMRATPEPEAPVLFVAGFAEPQTELAPAPVRAPSHSLR